MHEKVTVAMVKYYMYIVPFCSPSEMVWYFFSAFIINNNYLLYLLVSMRAVIGQFSGPYSPVRPAKI